MPAGRFNDLLSMKLDAGGLAHLVLWRTILRFRIACRQPDVIQA